MLNLPSEDAAKKILDTQIQGRLGAYHIEQWLKRRGCGHLFRGIHLESGQVVTIKAYWLSHLGLSDEAIQQRQQAFLKLATLEPVDSSSLDAHLQVIWPQEAMIAPQSQPDCYLISSAQDASPTLREVLAAGGTFSPDQVYDVLLQTLQTLERLHQQPVRLPGGATQPGLVHGGIDLDSLLWVETPEVLIYLCDFQLWEHIFLPPASPAYHTIAQDLSQLGRVGLQLLAGQFPDQDWQNSRLWPNRDPALEHFLRQLLALAPPFQDAEAARQALLSLPPTPPRRFPWRWLAWGTGLGSLVLALLAWLLWSPQPRKAVLPQPRECCLESVNAVPTGQFIFTAVEGSLWSEMAAQDGTAAAQSPLAVLLAAQPELELRLQPADSLEAALRAVQTRQAAFAVLPLANNRDLPSGLTADIIAYDGIAVVIPAGSASPPNLPRRLNGHLTLEQLRQLYRGEVANWQLVGGPALPVRLYAPADQAAITLFQLLAADEATLPSEQAPVSVQLEPPEEMVRSQVNALETEQVGGIGFGPFSRLLSECSVYPLALKGEEGAFVQPVVQSPSGEPITPNADRCLNPDGYRLDLQLLAGGDYPLAYPVAVVYPQDNSLPPVGEKFAELMQTLEGQALLADEGFTPLVVQAEDPSP